VDKELRVGIVGCGRAGARRFKNVEQYEGARTVFVCDKSEPTLEAREAEFPGEIHFSTDWQHALARFSPDVVIISTPPAFHEECAVAAIGAGVGHLLVEKPLACTAESAWRLANLARSRNLHIKVGSNLRQFPEAQGLARLVESGNLGRVRKLMFSIGHDGSNLPSWALDPAVGGGGTLLDNGVHAIDLALNMALLPVRFEVAANLSWRHAGIDQEAAWSVQGDGVDCSFCSSWRKRDNVYFSAILEGDDGRAELTVSGGDSSLFFDGGPNTFTTRYREPADSWLADTRHFLDEVVKGGRSGASALDGAKTLTIVEKAYLAAKTGGRIAGRFD